MCSKCDPEYKEAGGVMRLKRRSPLDRKPPRNPGESLQLAREELIQDEWIPWVFLAALFVLYAFYEWMRWYLKVPPVPVGMTVLAVIAVGCCAYKYVSVRRRVKAFRLGEQGEKEVGHFLEQLRTKGCRVFHDIVGDGFNIDHLIISPRGLFLIETKTYSKPMRGRVDVEFDGVRLLLNGQEPKKDPIKQVRALSRWLGNLLMESTGRRFRIQCAVVFPGWYTHMRTDNKSDVWVLNPKLLPAFIEREPIVLQSEDIALVSSRITSHMQTVR
jgi:hypothetical protein